MTIIQAALAQLRAHPTNGAANLAACLGLVQQAAGAGARMIFLPEASDYLGGASGGQGVASSSPDSGSNSQSLLPTGHRSSGIVAAGQRLEHAHFLSALCEAARQSGIWISVGLHEEGVVGAPRTTTTGTPTRETSRRGLPFNTHFVINAEGGVVCRYRKLHLFDFADSHVESRYIRPGSALPPIVRTPVGRVAPLVCYDVRFPELSALLSHEQEAGLEAQVLLYPSAFALATGSAGHWEVLLRARAIECQCYVIASAQSGLHSEGGRESWGHSLVVDPWGQVLLDMGRVEGGQEESRIALFPLDMDQVAGVRARMPMSRHKRRDVYALRPVSASP